MIEINVSLAASCVSEATEQCNKHQSTYHVINGHVTSGSPEGGTIRFQYRKT